MYKYYDEFIGCEMIFYNRSDIAMRIIIIKIIIMIIIMTLLIIIIMINMLINSIFTSTHAVMLHFEEVSCLSLQI